MTTLTAGTDRVSLSLRVRQPRVVSTFRFPTGRIERELALPAFAVATRAGRILTLATPPGTLPPSNGIMRAVFGIAQLVLPAGSGRPVEWTTEEEDPSGRYRARYSLRSPSGAPLEIRKTKKRYLPGPARAGGPQVADKLLPQGSLVARFDPGAGRLLSLAGKEILTTMVSGRRVSRNETAVRFSLLRTETVSASELESLRRGSRTIRGEPLFVPGMRPETRQTIHRRRLRGTTTLGLIRRLDEASARGGSGTKERASLFLAFRSLAATRPGDCPLLGEILATSKAGSLVMGVVSAALGAVGHAAAQKALVAAIRRRISDAPALAVLVPVLATRAKPGANAERVLRRLASSKSMPAAASMA